MGASLPIVALPPLHQPELAGSVPARTNRARAAELTGIPAPVPAAPSAAQTIAAAIRDAVQEGVAVVAPYSSQGCRFETEVAIEHVAADGSRTTARARIAYGR